MNVKPIPDGYHTLTPYLTINDPNELIDYLRKAFGATVTSQHAMPDGKVGHAELIIGDSHVMLGRASAEWQARPGTIYMYVEDVDAVYRQAMAAGGTSIREPRTEFYGDRAAGLTDPQGNQWWLATHVEDVSEEEFERRASAAGR